MNGSDHEMRADHARLPRERLNVGVLPVATKERLAAMAASLCAVCSGVMVVKLVVPDPRDRALELRTYVCAECGHSRTYSVDGSER